MPVSGQISKELQIVLEVAATGVENLNKLKNSLRELSESRSRDTTTTMSYRSDGLSEIRDTLNRASSTSGRLREATIAARKSLDDYVRSTINADKALERLGRKGTQLEKLTDLVRGLGTTRDALGDTGAISRRSFLNQGALTSLRQDFPDLDKEFLKSIRPGEKQAEILQKISTLQDQLRRETQDLSEAYRLNTEEAAQLFSQDAKRVVQLQQLRAEEEALNRAKAGRALGFDPSELDGLAVEEVQATLRKTQLAQATDKVEKELNQEAVAAETAADRLRRLYGNTERTYEETAKLETIVGRVHRELRVLNSVGFDSTPVVGYQKALEQAYTGSLKTASGVKQTQGAFAALNDLVSRRGGFGGELIFSTGRLGFYALAASLIYNTAAALRFAAQEGVKFEQTLAGIQGILPSRTIIGRDLISDIAVENARTFGVSLTETAEAAKVFAQTGRSATQIGRDLRAAFLAVRGAGLQLNQASDLIIAIENITNGELEALEVLDRISRVESTRAITANDLAIAFQRLGPLVRQLKGDTSGLVDEFDIALGAVTAIVERTRVTGNNAATSLRFILSRLGRPEIASELQSLSGVRLAREGGQALRPYQEILEELATVYERLSAAGETGKAFQILSVLGGARQLQATATLLDNYGVAADIARSSALGFNDAQERTALVMDTLQVSMDKVKIAFSALGKQLTTDSVVNTSIKYLAGGVEQTINAFTGIYSLYGKAFTTAERLTSKLFGGTGFDTKYSFKPVDLSNVQAGDYSKLKRLNEVAVDSNLSIEDLIDTIRVFSNSAAEELEGRFGLTLTDLLSKLSDDTVDNQFRGIRDEFGVKLADALAKSSKEFQTLKQNQEDASSASDKAVIRTKRIAEAYRVLGAAVFATNASLNLNRQRLAQTLDVVGEDVGKRLNDSFEELRDLGNGLGTKISLSLRNLLSGRDISTLEGFNATMQALLKERVFEQFEEGLNGLTRSFFEAEGASEAFRQAIVKTLQDKNYSNYGQAALQALDEYARTFLSNADVQEQAVAGLVTRISELTGLKDKLSEGGSITGQFAGTQFQAAAVGLVTQAIDRIKELHGETNEAREALDLLEEILNSAESGTAAFLSIAEPGFVRIKQELFNLLAEFIKATDNAYKLGDVFGEIGIGFDTKSAAFEAARSFVEGLVTLPTNLTAEAAGALAQARNFASNLSEQAGKSAAATQEVLDAIRAIPGEEDPIGLGALSERSATSLQTLNTQYQGLVKELQKLDSESLRSLLEGSPEGERLFAIFSEITNSIGVSAEQALVNYGALLEFAEDYLNIQRETLLIRDLEKQELESELEIVKLLSSLRQDSISDFGDRALQNEQSRARITEQILQARGDEYNLIRTQLRNAEESSRLELSNLKGITDARIQGIERERQVRQDLIALQFKEDKDKNAKILAEKELVDSIARQRAEATAQSAREEAKIQESLLRTQEELISGNIVNAYSELSQQVQANVESATSGLRSVLSDYDAFTARGALRDVLTPISDTFLTRTADNFVNTLFDASKDTLFGNIAEAFGAGPEQRLRENLQTAFELGSQTFTQKMAVINNQFLVELAAILGVKGPSGKVGTEFTSTDLGGESTTRKLLGQVGTLATTLAVTQIAASQGRSAGNTNLGAGLGSAIAASIFQGSLVAGPVGALVGGILGSLIGSDQGKDDTEKQLQALNKIEYNTDRSANVLELQRQFIDVARGAVNVPTAFSLPAYTPGGAGAQISQTNQISIEVSVQNPESGEAVIESITTALGPRLTEELRNLGL